MAVPESAVNEHGNLGLAEREIRFPGEIGPMAAPSAHAEAEQGTAELQLGARVAALHLRHDSASLDRRHLVGQGVLLPSQPLPRASHKVSRRPGARYVNRRLHEASGRPQLDLDGDLVDVVLLRSVRNIERGQDRVRELAGSERMNRWPRVPRGARDGAPPGVAELPVEVLYWADGANRIGRLPVGRCQAG